jgi:protein-L-isoaspartate(D-aspartate) O-methyltransferase
MSDNTARDADVAAERPPVDPLWNEIVEIVDALVNLVMGPAASRGGSFAYLACRRLDEREPSERGVWEFGARGFGPHARVLADLVVAEVCTWDGSHRYAPAPRIIARPADALAQPPAVDVEIVKRHIRISTVWG